MSRAGDPSDISKKQRRLRADTAERLEAIVEAAERAAENVIDDAEAQARQHLAQARAEAERLEEGRAASLAELIDPLLDQVQALRQDAERLQATLEEAKAKAEGGGRLEPGGQPESEPARRTPRLRAVASEDSPEGGSGKPASEGRRSDPAGARLLATQLAVQGSSREEIEQRLRNGFEIEDAGAILDAILGPED